MNQIGRGSIAVPSAAGGPPLLLWAGGSFRTEPADQELAVRLLPADPLTSLAIPSVVMIVAALACYLPHAALPG
jgi:hypothetical protein